MAECIAPLGVAPSLFSTPLPLAADGNVVVPSEVCVRAGVKPGAVVCARVIAPGRILLVAFPPNQADSAMRDASRLIAESMDELAKRFDEVES